MTQAIKKTGVIIGKFMPLHKGHEFIINFALNLVDELTILVDNLPADIETVSLKDRVDIMQKTFPNSRVVGMDVVTYQDPSEVPHFWEFWREVMLRNIGYTPDYVIGSMDYVKRLSEEIGCDYVIVDQPRSNYPISATMIRDGIHNYMHGDFDALNDVWKFASEHSRNHFLQHVYMVGGESVGKTTLSKLLAERLKATYVEEYARLFIEERNGQVLEKDMYTISIAQRAIQDVMKRHSKLFCFHDTDLITTKIWHKKLFGTYPEWIDEKIKAQPDGLYFLIKPTAIWQADVTRFYPENEDRDWFHEEFKRQLTLHKKNFIEIDGDIETRFNTVLKNIGFKI